MRKKNTHGFCPVTLAVLMLFAQFLYDFVNKAFYYISSEHDLLWYIKKKKKKFSHIRKTIIVPTDPLHTAEVCSFIEHHISPQINNLQQWFVHSYAPWAVRYPQHSKRPVIHKTPWIMRYPQHTRFKLLGDVWQRLCWFQATSKCQGNVYMCTWLYC